jgi:hypothetical protein
MGVRPFRVLREKGGLPGVAKCLLHALRCLNSSFAQKATRGAPLGGLVLLYVGQRKGATCPCHSSFSLTIRCSFDLVSYWQESLTIFTSLTFRWPCSLSFFVIPLSLAASFVSSFKLCIFACETSPVACTVCPT